MCAIGIRLNARGATGIILAGVGLASRGIDARIFVALILRALIDYSASLAAPEDQSMTEAEFMEIVCEVRNIDDPSFLDIPLEAVPFDSLDLLELRASLETSLQLPLTDEKFNSASTLRDLYLLVNR